MSDEFNIRALNYVGALTFSHDFREERDQIRAGIVSIEPQNPLTAMLIIGLRVPGLLMGLYFSEGQDSTRLEPNLARFVSEHRSCAEAYLNFLLKWELSGFATWDLPIPQQPHRGIPLEHLIRLVGTNAVVDYYPTYYSIRADEDVRQQIQSRQRTVAHSRGQTGEFPLSAPTLGDSQLGTAFRMCLIEQTLRRRYGNPRGIVSRLTRAFCDCFDLRETTIKDYRSKYRAILD